MELYQKTVQTITKPDYKVMQAAQDELNNLLKPPGSLGKLEQIAKKLSGITGRIKNKIDKAGIIVMASDNGVFEENVSSFPQNITKLVAETMARGISGVAVLAKHAEADLFTVDIGINDDQPIDGIVNRKIRKGTDNIAKGPAMSEEEVYKAIEIGIEIVNDLVENGYNLIGTGEVGIANTTTSSAVLYALTGKDLDKLVGTGAGLDTDGLERKKSVVKKSIEVNNPDKNNPIDILQKVGGFDIAGLVGVFLACAAKKVPVVIDGFISGTAALLAYNIKKDSSNYFFGSHSSEEPGGKIVNDILGIEPMLKMNMRLGEGTGCALAFNIIKASCAVMNNMGTFKDIGM